MHFLTEKNRARVKRISPAAFLPHTCSPSVPWATSLVWSDPGKSGWLSTLDRLIPRVRNKPATDKLTNKHSRSGMLVWCTHCVYHRTSPRFVCLLTATSLIHRQLHDLILLLRRLFSSIKHHRLWQQYSQRDSCDNCLFHPQGLGWSSQNSHLKLN